MKRIFLFVMTNLAVMVVLGVVAARALIAARRWSRALTAIEDDFE